MNTLLTKLPRIVARAVFVALAGIHLSAAAVKPLPPVDLTISADEGLLTAGKKAPVLLVVQPLADIEQAVVEFEVVTGDALITGPKLLTLGPLSNGGRYIAETRIALTGQGTSEVRGFLHARDGAGRELFMRSAAVLIAVSGDEVATGTAGLIPLQMEALTRNLPAKAPHVYDAEVLRIMTGGAMEQKHLDVTSAKAGTISVQGTIVWTDSAGVTHPARAVTVEIRDKNTIDSELVMTTFTIHDGTFGVTVSNNDTFGTGGRDIFIRAGTTSAHCRVVSSAVETRKAHWLQSSVTDDVPDGATLTINLTATRTTRTTLTSSDLRSMRPDSPYIALRSAHPHRRYPVDYS